MKIMNLSKEETRFRRKLKLKTFLKIFKNLHLSKSKMKYIKIQKRKICLQKNIAKMKIKMIIKIKNKV
jgi:hypothetical protein